MSAYKPRTQCGGRCSTSRTGGVCTCVRRKGPADKAGR